MSGFAKRLWAGACLAAAFAAHASAPGPGDGAARDARPPAAAAVRASVSDSADGVVAAVRLPGSARMRGGLDSLDAVRTIATVAGSQRPERARRVARFVRPPFLREGDSVGLVAISSKTDSARMKHYLAAVDTVRSWGLSVRLAAHLFDRSGGWFASADSVRAQELQQMLENPHLRAVLFFRGGYGAVRVLDRIDLGAVLRDPKWLVGFSDLTTVHYALHKAGIESIHGTMPSNFRTGPAERDTSALWLREALFGRVGGYVSAPHPFNRPGEAQGRLSGGNLSVVSAMNGMPEDNDFSEPTILLIEDVGESIHHIDRMLRTLLRSGRLERIAGLVVGDFTHIRGEKQWGSSVYELISEYAGTLDIPVLFGFPAGHGRLNAALYMGREVRLTVSEEGGELRFL